MSAPALLAAILASPDDDLPRLVYADWLDENGDPARAEFIRTQIELAKLPDHDPRFRLLEDREHELLSEHEAGWFPDHRGVHEWEWKRGFVGSLSGDCHRFRLAQNIFAQHPISHVDAEAHVDDLNVKDTWLGNVRSMSVSQHDHDAIGVLGYILSDGPFDLHSLDMSVAHPQADRADVFALQELFSHWSGRNRLVRLRMNGNLNIFDGRIRRARPFIDQLDTVALNDLGIADTHLDGADLLRVLSAPFAGTLKHLDISDNPIAPDAYRAFQQCHPNMRLDKLDVSGTPLAGISLEPLLNAISLRSLTKLEMNGCGSARRNMEVLANSAFWTQATELRAHSGTIPASTLEPLCTSAGPPGLRLLDLADNYVRTEGVRMLCESPWAGSLTWLALSRNYLDDESCEVLAKSGRFTNLRTLHLARHNGRQEGADGEWITTAGVRALAAAPSLANLRLLTLSYTCVCAVGIRIALEHAHWRLYGLGVAGCNLNRVAVAALVTSPRLARLTWLDLSDNRELGGQVLRPLAESPYLSPLCELDCGGIAIDDDVRAIFRERLGPRFSH